MQPQEATAVISAPITELEDRLADVQSWPAFLVGLVAVEPLGYERYRFRLVDGPGRRDRRETIVCVRRLGATHRFTWKALEGPAYAGYLQLTPLDARHTAVRLSLTCHPASFRAGLAEMVMPQNSRAARDLFKLEEHVLRSA
jgi:Polyketide cyclase / dehydrase and lipid transport